MIVVRDLAVLGVRVENTPAADDPMGAREFYQMLGMATMALGRIDGHFTLCVLTLMNLPGAEALGHILPISWKKRSEMWRRAFKAVPMLQPYRATALPLLSELMDLMQDRHNLAHAIWQGFVPGPVLTVSTVHLRHRRGTTDGLLFSRTEITIDMLREVLRKANILNRELLPLSRFLTSLRSAPPGTRAL